MMPPAFPRIRGKFGVTIPPVPVSGYHHHCCESHNPNQEEQILLHYVPSRFGMLAGAISTFPDTIRLLFMWSANLCCSYRTGPLLFNPHSRHTSHSLSTVRWYTLDANRAMQHNKAPTRTHKQNPTAQQANDDDNDRVPEENHTVLTKMSPHLGKH
jgi:hypothetical protein